MSSTFLVTAGGMLRGSRRLLRSQVPSTTVRFVSNTTATQHPWGDVKQHPYDNIPSFSKPVAAGQPTDDTKTSRSRESAPDQNPTIDMSVVKAIKEEGSMEAM